MNYELPQKINWYHYLIISVVVLFLFLNNYIETKYFDLTKIDFVLWGFIVNALAVLVAVIVYLSGLVQQNQINRELEKLLFNELFNNLLYINTNLKKIEEFEKDPKIIHGFNYISNNIFYSIINSDRVIILMGKMAPLMSFYNCDQSIRRVLDNVTQIRNNNPLIPIRDFEMMLSVPDGKGSLVKNKLLEMKKLLEEIFKLWRRESDYKEWGDKTFEEWVTYKSKSKLNQEFTSASHRFS